MAAKNLTILAVLLFITSCASAQYQLPTQEIKGTLYVTVQIGNRQGLFLVDTGADITVVTPKLSGLSDEQLRMAATTNAKGAIGASSLPLASVRISFDHYSLWAHTVAVSKLTGIDGILGNDVLSRFSRVTFDRKQHLLILEE